MSRHVAAALLAVGLVAVVGGTSPGQTATLTSQPAELAAVGDHAAGAAEGPGKLRDDLRASVRWACILSGLSLVGVIWVVWSLRKLAVNQVTLARLIQDRDRSG